MHRVKNVGTGEEAMIREGTYRARCTGERDVQFGYSDDGKEQLAVLFDLLDETGKPTGERVSWIGFFSEKSLPITRRVLEVCGCRGDSLAALAGIDANEVELVVRHASAGGERYARVVFVNKPGAGGRIVLKNRMRDSQRFEFAQRMRDAIAEERHRSVDKPGVKRTSAPRRAVRAIPLEEEAPATVRSARG